MALFALDHNYPTPIVDEARPYLRDVELVPIGDIDARLPDFDDWELLLALYHHERDWDGMVTNDTSMLEQDRELAVLGFTCLTLVAPVAAGHDPIRSTGLLLAHIENIANRTTPSKPQVWKLHGRTPQAQHSDVFLGALARRAGLDPIDVRKAATPDRSVLARDPLGGLESDSGSQDRLE